ncbi:MAG: hypothetical protein Q8M07_20100 [Prosthecobacter sp.]|nr:hypothetical protein [Prosthecobacter sp.]
MGGMADMCAKMAASKEVGKGGPMADEKKAAMMGDMKGCADMCADMCANMAAAKDVSKGDPKAKEKMAAMMGNMKGCKMMSGASAQGPGENANGPRKPSNSDEHSEHHPPK